MVEYEEGGLYELHNDAFPFAGTLPTERQPSLGGQVVVCVACSVCVCVCARACACHLTGGVGRIEVEQVVCVCANAMWGDAGVVEKTKEAAERADVSQCMRRGSARARDDITHTKTR